MNVETQISNDQSVVHETDNAGSRYDICTEGSLTYFRYYFDEEYVVLSNPASHRPTRDGSLAIALAGVGITLAAFAAGVAFAKTTHPSAKEQVSHNIHPDVQAQPIKMTKVDSSQMTLLRQKEVQAGSVLSSISRPETIIDPYSQGVML